MRYVTDDWFQGNKFEIQEEYASTSWNLIVSSGSAMDEGADTAVVCAIALLAIIDSAGK